MPRLLLLILSYCFGYNLNVPVCFSSFMQYYWEWRKVQRNSPTIRRRKNHL